ncbi:segmentation protein cap'n'collar-like [Zerene cesonia]|uniref:segmentation protein cap'n'collar-like n=1 Tax=Zerene cesonia TaxID=33412 RepID=UPI0018E52EFC|nr:segmentation protein cap'n'collar-like [Zerene cesonia]
MIALKKLYGDELLRLALVLSLLKANPEEYLEIETQQMITGLHISNGSDWSLEQEARTLIRPRYVHPKSLDNILVNYERQLFEELNSLGRYNYRLNNDRMWHNRAIHTYLVNNVATTVQPVPPSDAERNDTQDAVAADDNVAQEVKITEEESADADTQPDAVVTLSADYFENRTETDIFAEIGTRSFDVNEFLVNHTEEMQIKREPPEELLDVRVKKERDEDLYSDNAIDDYVPYFTAKAEKLELGEPNSVFHQNLADLQDYGELFDDVKELRNDLEYLDVKQQQENLEQYLLENTPLDTEVYELAPIFEEELVLDVKRERASTSFTSASSSGVSEMDVSDVPDVKMEPDEGHHTGDELTQEDMDLIEVLWKQDVDMGFSLDDPLHIEGPQATKVELAKELDKDPKALEKTVVDDNENIEKVKASLLDADKDDLWAGLSYTVDTETGECVLQGDLPRELDGAEESRFDLLEEALQLVELRDEAKDAQPEAVGGSGGGAEMLHPAMRHMPHHPLAHYHNQSFMRSMSVEQRWQDLASLLTIPPPPEQYQHYHQHAHHAHNISHGAAGYAPNYAPHAPLGPGPTAPHAEKHSESYGAAAPLESSYKVESAHHPQQHDAVYYQNSTSEMAPNQDGFLQSILNDEDLQLMDMAMNEGMYTMRMLDGASAHVPQNHPHMPITTAERDSASDSAVSSMGSERVPSLSDGEWCDGSDSAQEYHRSKFRPYESAYARDRAHAPQKKHHMFGKRCFQEQPQLEPLVSRPPAVKYECEQTYHHDSMHMHNVDFTPRHQLGGQHVPLQPALDLNTAHSSHAIIQSNVSPARFPHAEARVRHNHTYSAPPPPDQRQPIRDKRARRLTESSGSESGHLSRDEKRAKALGIPLEVHDIINLPMDEFNERLSKHDLSEAQLSLIRDIRRRGKNKVSYQLIISPYMFPLLGHRPPMRVQAIIQHAEHFAALYRHVFQVSAHTRPHTRTHPHTHPHTRPHTHTLAQRQRLKEHFAALYRHVFQNLRDGEGRPLSSAQYSLQQAADGNVVLVPKMSQHADHTMNRTSDDDMDRKKSYE